MDDLETVGRHVAGKLDYIKNRLVAISGLLNVAQPERADNFALVEAALDLHDLAVTESEWARSVRGSLNDPQALALLTGYRVKLLELEAGCIALANGTDRARVWQVAGEMLAQRSQLPF